MQFYLRTGFGESPEIFGGTDSHPFEGSGQGSGWASPGFGALSSIAIGAYKGYRGGAKITSPYLARVFLIATGMYVDDTDLLHWAASPEVKDEELIESVQSDIKVWGEIVQSMGGIVKAIKYSLVLLTCKWPTGRARLKTMNNIQYDPHEVVVKTPVL